MSLVETRPGRAEDAPSGAQIRSDLQSIRRLWQLAGPLRGRIAAGIACRFAQSACLGLGLWAAIRLVRDVLRSGFVPEAGWVLGITGLCLLSLAGQVLFSYLTSRMTWFAAFDLGAQLRLAMLERLRDLPLGFHLSRNRGDTVSMLTSDMQTIESFMSDGLPRIAEALGLPVVLLIFLAWQDPVVALAALIPIALALPLYVRISRSLARLGIRRQDMQATAAARMIEFVQGLAVIRSFNRLSKGAEDFRDALDDFRGLSVSMTGRLTLPLAAFGMLVMLGVPLILLAAGGRWLGGGIETATAVAACMLIHALYGPVLGLIPLMENTRMADAALSRIDRVLEARPLPWPETSVAPHGFAVAFDGVGFGYGRDPVLEDISFAVPEGRMTAIVGPSGAGKSTILSLLARFWDVDEGRITIGGTDLRQMAPDRLAGLITFVFQDVYLFSGTIFDNIAFGRLGASRQEVEAAARAAQAHDFIMALPQGYDTPVGEAGAGVSGGERQRISIARAILKDAPIVLMDEATAALDPGSERALQAALAALVAHKTLIIVAHKLSTVQAADEIIVLEQGRIRERGTHADLVAADGLYAGLWRHWQGAAHWRLGASAAE